MLHKCFHLGFELQLCAINHSLLSVKLHLHSSSLCWAFRSSVYVTAVWPGPCNRRYVSVSFKIIKPDSLNRAHSARHGTEAVRAWSKVMWLYSGAQADSENGELMDIWKYFKMIYCTHVHCYCHGFSPKWFSEKYLCMLCWETGLKYVRLADNPKFWNCRMWMHPSRMWMSWWTGKKLLSICTQTVRFSFFFLKTVVLWHVII